jgi:hypothetical protein
LVWVSDAKENELNKMEVVSPFLRRVKSTAQIRVFEFQKVTQRQDFFGSEFEMNL